MGRKWELILHFDLLQRERENTGWVGEDGRDERGEMKLLNVTIPQETCISRAG